MQVTTDLRPMFSYSLLYILLLIVLIILLYVLYRRTDTKEIKEEVIPIVPDNLGLIKKKYLKKIDKLSEDATSGEITSRQAYQTLSKIIRNFIYEATNIKVQNCTLKEIKSLDMPKLSELVSEYYDPEFSKVSEGNIVSSIKKTRTVIEKWN